MKTALAANADLATVLREMDDARERLAALVAPLTAEDMPRARPGSWTLSRVLEHLIDSEGVYGKLLAHQCGRTAPDMRGGEPRDGVDAMAMLEERRRTVLEIIEGIDDETLYRLVRFGHEEYSPLSVLQNIASHDRDHQAQLEDLAARVDRAAPVARGPLAVRVRYAAEGDLPALTEIYNHYVIHTPITFDLEAFTVEQRRVWFSHYARTGRHRLWVAEADGAVIGYAGTSQFRTKRAYDTTVEVSIYCAPDATGRGVGTRLYTALFDAMRGEDVCMAVAGITVPNAASIALHEQFGFRQAGLLHAVGRKFDRYWDVAWYEKRF